VKKLATSIGFVKSLISYKSWPSRGLFFDCILIKFNIQHFCVQYPQKWVTNSPKIAGKCHYFGKQPFQVEPYKKNVFISIQMENDSLQKYRTTKNRDNNKNNLGSKKLYRNTTTISDRQTIVTEVEGTGKVMLRQGIKMYIYQVDMGDRTLVARTYEIPSQNYHRNKKIMDAMMDSLEIKAPSPK
jgi:hypothetical protein